MYVFISADALDAKGRSVGSALQSVKSLESGFSNIRRPYRGLQIKDDTYATISIWSNGKPLLLKSESSGQNTDDYIGWVDTYADFILQSVQDQRTEKMQIIETFGEPYVYFYGEKPRFVTFSGVLVSSEDFNWRSQFWDNYENFMRGTRLVHMNARAYLSYDSIVVEGYPIQASATDDANQPALIPFSMTMLVTNYYDYTQIGDIRFPGYEGIDTEAINASLIAINETRRKYISTTLQVRYKNFTEVPAGGLMSSIKKGLREVNDITQTVGGAVNAFNTVMSGRTVRVPVGVAGYLAGTGRAVFGAGSVDSGLLPFYNSAGIATGTSLGIPGKLSIRIPSISGWAVRYSSPLVADYNGLRGFKFDNYDEYPLAPPKTLKSLLGDTLYAQYQARQEMRNAAVELDNMFLTAFEEITQAGGMLEEGIADLVNATKTGIGLVMSAKSFAEDPLGVFKAMLGITAVDINWGQLGIPVPTDQSGLPSDVAGASFGDMREINKMLTGPWVMNPTLAKTIMAQQLNAKYAGVLMPGETVDDMIKRTAKQTGETEEACRTRLRMEAKYESILQPSETIDQLVARTAKQYGMTEEAVRAKMERETKYAQDLLPGEETEEMITRTRVIEQTMGKQFVSGRSARYIRDKLKTEGYLELGEVNQQSLKTDTSNQERASYIGSKARQLNQSFQQVLEDERLNLDLFGDPNAEIEAGIVYESSAYKPSSRVGQTLTEAEKQQVIDSRSQFYPPIDYEPIYGENDYTSLADRPTVASQAIQLVKETYGNVASDQPVEITEQTIEAVYGSGYASKQAKTQAQVLETLRRMGLAQEQTSEQAIGIRGIDDDDSPIDPVR